MRKNRKRDMTPFDMSMTPKRQNIFLLPLVWLGAFLMTRKGGLKIHKKGVEGLKPPFLVLSMHQGFTDYFITPLSLFPKRASYISDMEGFANYGKWIYSSLGCIGTRRFVSDLALIKNIQHVVTQNKDIIVIFPEARHSNVGTNSALPESVGKLIKLLNLPVVVQKVHGSYLTAPIWDENHIRKVPLEATLEKIIDLKDIAKLSAKELTQIVELHFQYDEYQWQYENKVRIDDKERGRGLHKVLYQCPSCNKEYSMRSKKTSIFCQSCHKEWIMDQYGRLKAVQGKTEFTHIPDWYEYQREQVKKQIFENRYHMEEPVKIEALPNEKGFVDMGDGLLEQSEKGFTLTFHDSKEIKFFSAKSMHSVHTEYNYRGKGDSIVLSDKNCCYYLYGQKESLKVTKIQFAAEIMNK